MTFKVISFFRTKPARDWSNDELAQLYRVDGALAQLGIAIETERGLTDEGDPWFTFCRADGGDVLVHIARFDGDYHLIASTVSIALRGKSFAELTQMFVQQFPVTAPLRKAPNVFLHPASMFTMLVAAVFFSSEKTHAANSGVAAADGSGDAAGVDGAGFGGVLDADFVGKTDGAAPRGDNQNSQLSIYLNAVGAAIALVLGVVGDQAFNFVTPTPLQLANGAVPEISDSVIAAAPVVIAGLTAHEASQIAASAHPLGADATTPQTADFQMHLADKPLQLEITAPMLSGDVPGQFKMSAADHGAPDAPIAGFGEVYELIRSLAPTTHGSGAPEGLPKTQVAEARAAHETGSSAVPSSSSAVGDKVGAGSATSSTAKFAVLGQIGAEDVAHIVTLKATDTLVALATNVSSIGVDTGPAKVAVYDDAASKVVRDFMARHDEVYSLTDTTLTYSDGIDDGHAVTLYTWQDAFRTISIVGHLPNEALHIAA